MICQEDEPAACSKYKLMRVLLRKRGSGFYYSHPGEWGANPEKGFDFGSIQNAMEWAGKTGPEDMELALAFDGSTLISAVSLAAARAQLSKRH